MKSPFPGMDPYIEAHGLWGDFHSGLIEGIHSAVSQALPENYVARTGRRSYIVVIESEEKRERHFEPDIKITSRRGPKSRGKAAQSEPAMENGAPVSLRAFI